MGWVDQGVWGGSQDSFRRGRGGEGHSVTGETGHGKGN
jgi:hypothetical protein